MKSNITSRRCGPALVWLTFCARPTTDSRGQLFLQVDTIYVNIRINSRYNMFVMKQLAPKMIVVIFTLRKHYAVGGTYSLHSAIEQTMAPATSGGRSSSRGNPIPWNMQRPGMAMRRVRAGTRGGSQTSNNREGCMLQNGLDAVLMRPFRYRLHPPGVQQEVNSSAG